MKRTAKKGDISPDRLAAGQAPDGLVDNCLENRSGEIFPGSPLVDQRLDIRLGKYAAAGRNGVDHLVIFGIFI